MRTSLSVISVYGTCMCICGCAHVCVHIRRQKDVRWFPQWFSVLCLWDRAFHWITSLPFQPGQLANELWDPSVSSPTSSGLQDFTDMPGSLFRSWRFKLRSSGLQSKQAYSWGQIPSPFLGFDYNTSAIIYQLLDFQMCTLKRWWFWFCSRAEVWRSGPASTVWGGGEHWCFFSGV